MWPLDHFTGVYVGVFILHLFLFIYFHSNNRNTKDLFIFYFLFWWKSKIQWLLKVITPTQQTPGSLFICYCFKQHLVDLSIKCVPLQLIDAGLEVIYVSLPVTQLDFNMHEQIHTLREVEQGSHQLCNGMCLY